MTNGKSLRLGIVGGLGAVAGADLLYRIVKNTPVRSEDDHRELIFEQRPLREPVPPMGEHYNPSHRKFYVFDTLSRMEREGCDAAILPCFVSHCFLDELAEELDLKLISMTEAVQIAVMEMDPRPEKVGVVTTPFARKNRLFDDLFSDEFEVVYPNAELEKIIMYEIYGENGFKSGNRSPRLIRSLNNALNELRENGASVFVPGLTEIPLMFDDLDVPDGMTAINTATIYSQHALALTEINRKQQFKVGVVGGVGPAATVDFLSKLVVQTNATCDQDHIKVLLEQNPQIPDRTENLLGDGKDPSVALYSTCKKLERGGADLLAIPCNTAHAYVDWIQRYLEIPIVSILTATTEHIRTKVPFVKKVGILATSGTVQTGLYQQALRADDLEYILPDEIHQELVMSAIYGPQGVKAGYTEGECKEQIDLAFKDLVDRGAEAIILGCTELPLLVSETEEKLGALPVDPTTALAWKCVELATN